MSALQLKFGTALFLFRDDGHLRAFVENYCFKDVRGRIFLHHGIQYHSFTELSKDHYKILPTDLKFTNRNRTSFMKRPVTEKEDMTV